MTEREQAYFGFEPVSAGEKTRRVAQVFSSVSRRYDLMNDLMSLGVHRLWKRFAVGVSGVRTGARVLDLAGGTGDCARLFRRRVGAGGEVILCDVNADMLMQGRDRLLDAGTVAGMDLVQGDAEHLPFRDASFDCVNIAFGLRNVTRQAAALEAMNRALKFGGVAVVLEFSRVVLPLLARLYDAYSMKIIPPLGKLVAGDEDSYRYLVESIRRHPAQDELKGMMQQAGFSRVDYFNLSGGIVAVHRGYRL